MCPCLGFLQIKAGSADDNFLSEIQEAGKCRLQIEQHGTIVHHSQHVDAETRLKGCILVKIVRDDVRNDTTPQIKHNAYALAVRFITQIHNTINLAFIDECGDLLHQHRLVYAIGNFPDDYGLAVLVAILNLHLAADFDGTTTCAIGVGKPLARIDKPSGGKIRSMDVLHELVHRRIGIS